jgi:OmpA-OmpF porin, OOP family
MSLRFAALSLIALTSLLSLPRQADAQIGNRVREAAARAAERETLRQVDRKVTNTVRCVFDDAECIRKAQREGNQVEVTDKQGNIIKSDEAGAAGGGAATQRVGEGAWANYDFVPGDRVLFADDLSADRIGNFPRRLEFGNGNMEIVEWQGARYLRSTSEGFFDVVLTEPLPERFTIEFDLHDPGFWPTEVYSVDPNRKYEEHVRAFFSFNGSSGLADGNRSPSNALSSMRVAPTEKMMRVSMIADGPYMKVFLDETRIANVPTAAFARTNRIRFKVHGETERSSLIGNIRVAAGGTSLYDALQADGRVSTQGILFDTGSERIRPESTPTLKEIGEMLRQHPSLRLRIEGHTDNVGQATANQALSEKRAAAVRQHLVSSYGIDGDRLQAVGKGQEEPADSNGTPEGRQNNRRVVLVRL